MCFHYVLGKKHNGLVCSAGKPQQDRSPQNNHFYVILSNKNDFYLKYSSQLLQKAAEAKVNAQFVR